MKSTPKRLIRKIAIPVWLIAFVMICSSGYSQPASSPKTPAKRASDQPRKSADKMAIDSLKLVTDELSQSLKKTDSLYKAEKFVSADLRDQILKLDDYRKKLESNNQNFKGENLKLNQSNRILIIFNSLVAVLLVITLVFFLKRLSRKKANTESESVQATIGIEPSTASTRFASFEDRLMQLERLGKLREKGLLSEAEFVAEKQKILGK